MDLRMMADILLTAGLSCSAWQFVSVGAYRRLSVPKTAHDYCGATGDALRHYRPGSQRGIGHCGDLLSLYQIDYPKGKYDVHVIADNCDDRTVEVVQTLRPSPRPGCTSDGISSNLAKGMPCAGCSTVLSSAEYDAYVVLDADCTASTNMLRVMDARLRDGSR